VRWRTTSDDLTILDASDAPETHHSSLDDLRVAFGQAGRQNAERRAEVLGGAVETVRNRGVDWAQVRPEWGLARNAAFIIAPRSVTTGLDLDGRAFLHDYDADSDPQGRVLETIMTGHTKMTSGRCEPLREPGSRSLDSRPPTSSRSTYEYPRWR